jgi:hypothetical protein
MGALGHALLKGHVDERFENPRFPEKLPHKPDMTDSIEIKTKPPNILCRHFIFLSPFLR